MCIAALTLLSPSDASESNNCPEHWKPFILQLESNFDDDPSLNTLILLEDESGEIYNCLNISVDENILAKIKFLAKINSLNNITKISDIPDIYLYCTPIHLFVTGIPVMKFAFYLDRDPEKEKICLNRLEKIASREILLFQRDGIQP